MVILNGSLFLELVTVFVLLVVFVTWNFVKAFSYWEKKGIPTISPSFPTGNIGSSILHGERIGNIIKRIYNATKNQGSFSGIYLLNKPGLIVNDPEEIKSVLVRNFKNFYNRGMYYNVKDDPLSGNLFFIDGHKWKGLREKITPTFTSGKMKQMFPLMRGCAEQIKGHLDQKVVNHEIEIRDVMYRFTIDVIGTCVFGIECDSLKDSNSEFRRNGEKVLEYLLEASFTKNMIFKAFKNVSRKLGATVFSSKVTKFFIKIVKDTVEYREVNKEIRHDFMQLLINLKSKEFMENKIDGKNSANFRERELTLNEMAAQVLIFFIAGFESSASTISFCLHELSLHKEIQEKARKEVREVLEKYDGKITYEALQEMKFLDQCIYETWRKYPTLPILNRECTQEFTLPGTDITIPKGMPIFIPVMGLHYDPEYYPDPDKFDPDRFTEENKSKRHSFAYLPFGEGPRVCIGIRFGMTQTRLGLATILMDYELEHSEKTSVPLELNPTTIPTMCATGIYLKLKSLSKPL